MHCYCSRISTPSTASSTIFNTQINKYDCGKRSDVALAFSMRRAKINHDSEYCTRLNRFFDSTLGVCNFSLSANNKSASDFS